MSGRRHHSVKIIGEQREIARRHCTSLLSALHIGAVLFAEADGTAVGDRVWSLFSSWRTADVALGDWAAGSRPIPQWRNVHRKPTDRSSERRTTSVHCRMYSEGRNVPLYGLQRWGPREQRGPERNLQALQV